MPHEMWWRTGLPHREIFFNKQSSVATFPSKTIRPPESHKSEYLRTWKDIVETYSQCQLTKEADKLIAISAIARAMKPMIECRYLAGLWEENLVNQLGWYIAGGPQSRPGTYRAPSWSWTSVEGLCVFMHISEGEHPLIEIRSAHVDLASKDEMGPVEGGHLEVIGQLFVLDWNPCKPFFDLQIPGFDERFTIHKDCPLKKADGPFHLLPLTTTPLINIRRRSFVKALVLQQCGNQAGYQRVGSGNSLYLSSDSPFLKMLGDFMKNDDGSRSFSRNDSRMQNIWLE